MSTAAKLKKKAAEFEQKKQFDKALQAYLQALEASAAEEEGDADVALYNRVGDLFMRENNVSEAMKYYDRAVDLYSEGGFYNNAIALCNKILRLSPGRNSVYYKLGRISARKGFINDAKQNFLEYAHRMQTAGHLDEAFRALKEFADLVPDQEDVRLMLAEQLTKQGRTGEAVEQLQRLYEKFQAEGRGAEMRATVDRMKRIGAGDIAPSDSSSAQHKTSELVFLDLGDSGSRPPSPRPPSAARSEPPTAPTESRPSAEPRTGELEPTSVEGERSQEIPFLDVGEPVREATGRSEPPTGPSTAPPVHPSLPMSRRTPGVAVPPIEPLGSQEFAKLRLPTPLDLPAIVPSAHDLTIPGQLPSLDPGSTPPNTAPAAGRMRSAPLSLTPEMTVLIPDEPMPPRPRGRAKSGIAPDAAKPPEPARAPQAMSEPVDWVARRKAAEGMFEAGDREGGLRELTAVMLGVEQGGDLVETRSVVEEILRIDPNSVPHHQKRAELAARSNDTAGLPDAYVALGDALFRDGQLDSARAIYRRVLELVPNDPRAVTALSTFGEPAAEALSPPPPPPSKALPPEKPASAAPTTGRPRRAAAAADAAPEPPANGAPAEGTDGGGRGSDFVNLGDWLRDESGPKSTRMVIPEHRPSGDEAKDFALMLHNFKAGVAQNVELDDSESHFDLGVAYKEMGLLDEAIAEFQRSLQGPGRRVRTYEALGQCFLEKRQTAVASTILARALQETGTTEEQLVGVLYLLGYAAEAQHQSVEAVRYYQRVFAVDIEFRDVSRRLAALEQAAR